MQHDLAAQKSVGPAKLHTGGGRRNKFCIYPVWDDGDALFGNSGGTHGLAESLADDEDAIRVAIDEMFKCVRRSNHHAISQHPEGNGDVRHQILDLQYKRNAAIARDRPGGQRALQWRRDSENKIGTPGGESAQSGCDSD